MLASSPYAPPGRSLQQGINMTIYVEGHRSFDGKLLPFKKGPFYLAMECGAPVVPITIVGTHDVMPKGKVCNQARNGDRDFFTLPSSPKISAAASV